MACSHVSNTVTKVTGRVRQLMTTPDVNAGSEASKERDKKAIRADDDPDADADSEERKELDKKAMRELFAALKDALSS
ncbi:hypothetical protein ACHAQA_007091 [Verticillium albo-atrum]